MVNATSYGKVSDGIDNRLDYIDKSEPIREHECIWCMACVTVCPTKAIRLINPTAIPSESIRKL